MRFAIVAVLVAGLAGCSKKPAPPSCAEVAENTLKVMDSQYHMGVGKKTELIAQCERDFDADMKRCLGAATTVHDVCVCRNGADKCKKDVKPNEDKPAEPDPHAGMNVH